MFAVKLLANCYIVLNMQSIFITFHISHTTWGIIDHSWKLLTMFNNVLTSYIKLCYVYVKFKRANQRCSPPKISQSINVEWRTCNRNGKRKQGSKKNFARLRMRECSNKKIEIWAVKNISPLGLAKYLSYSEVQKNRKVVNVWIRFQQVGSLF